MSIRRFASLFGVLVASLTVGSAQQATAPPPAPAQQGQQPTFRTRIDSVSVDVIVTDRQGKAVADLTPDDFEIKEAGKPQKVEAFKDISIDDTQDADPAYTRQILSMADQDRETANENNRIIIIMLDDYHVRKGNGMRIRERLAQWVSTLVVARSRRDSLSAHADQRDDLLAQS